MKMKKIASLIILVAIALSIVSCGNTEVRDISCEEIIEAYENAGYFVTHGEHKDEEDGSRLCYIRADISEELNGDYIYFVTCFTEEQAREAQETDKYNIVVWLLAALQGEGRWLKTGTYGKIEYSYYNDELIKPFEKLTKK